MGRIGLPELLVILVIILLLFGAARLPQIAKSLGEGIKEFRKALSKKGGQEEKEEKTSSEDFS
jgi:sec-independent protein translocase protein TatA